MENIDYIFPTGSKNEIFGSCETPAAIFDVLWGKASDLILQETLKREDNISVKDIKLLLASELVMGLNMQPQVADYFMNDDEGIFGCKWMADRFTQHKWSFLHHHIHFDPNSLMNHIRQNFQRGWNLFQTLVTDEMIIPFTGQWKHIQHVKNKPHNTGLIAYICNV